jgi:aryl-alcohol dehydrogenase-like predicted oxidoreductase
LLRELGRSGIAVSAVGFGCWPIGGAIVEDGRSVGWGDVDDRESIRALHRAIDLGVTLFETADVYGRSEELLGRAFAHRRGDVVFATKFGKTYDRERNEITGVDLTPEHMRRALEGSLRRLRTDVIDLYQLHVDDCAADEALALRDALEALVQEGTIRAYGWSTNERDNAELFAGGAGCAAIQHYLNVLEGTANVTRLCEREGLASINNGPLAMGLLTGKFRRDTRVSSVDVRGAGHPWMDSFEDGRPKDEYLDRVEAIRELLTTGGRTVAQGAIAWLWAFSDVTIPIPGFKTVAQAEENARALGLGPLPERVMTEIARVLDRAA